MLLAHLVIASLLFFSACPNDGEPGACVPKDQVPVSVIQLVATPERYHGKPIFVTGFLTIEKENDVLCATPVTASSADCIWVQFDDGPWEKSSDMKRYEAREAIWKKYSTKRVSLRGYFNKNIGSSTSGGIEKIIHAYSD